MVDRASQQHSTMHYSGHIIRFLRFRILDGTKFVAALARIEPPISLPGPDVVLGLGVDISAARKNALLQAKSRIKREKPAMRG
jgi:hypothetical protein